MRRIAANKVLIKDDYVLTNGIVELDDNNVVKSISCISNNMVEPSHTEFYNGVITAALLKNESKTMQLKEIVSEIRCGDVVSLLLWRNVDFDTLEIRDRYDYIFLV